MTVDEERMAYHGLRKNELWMLDFLMKIPMSQWPESLQDYTRERTRQIGLCGEVLLAIASEWIRKTPSKE